MNDTTAPPAGKTAPRRIWRARTFYISEEVARAAHRLADREGERSGRRIGAGVVLDRAMRRFLGETLHPEEIAALMQPASDGT